MSSTITPYINPLPATAASDGSEVGSVPAVSAVAVAPQPNATSLDQITGAAAKSPAIAVLGSSVPVPATSQPAGYTQNLASAKDKISNSAPLSFSTGAAIIAAENGSLKNLQSPSSVAAQRSHNPDSDSDNDDQSKKYQKQADVAAAQAHSIVTSAQASTTHGCKHTYTNNAALVGKMVSCGFTQNQASTLTQMLQDGRTNPAAKQKIAYELAALGMTDVGSANVAALASNASDIKQELASFADAGGAVIAKDKTIGGIGAAREFASLSKTAQALTPAFFGASTDPVGTTTDLAAGRGLLDANSNYQSTSALVEPTLRKTVTAL